MTEEVTGNSKSNVNVVGVSAGENSLPIQSFADMTEEEFSNAIELNDEWQDDDDILCTIGGLNLETDGLKLGLVGKQDDLQFIHRLTNRRELSSQFSADKELSRTHDSEDLLTDRLPKPNKLLAVPDDLDSSEPGTPRRTSTWSIMGAGLEWDNDTPIVSENIELEKPGQPGIMVRPLTVVKFESEIYRTVIIGDEEYKMDLSAIIPYKLVLQHGGYYGEGLNAIVVFSACYLPDSAQTDYDYIMDNLFLYVVSTLDLLVAEEYMIVFFNSGCKRKNIPSFAWLKKCYKLINHRLRKSLKQLLLVHPSLYMRALITFFRPFISSKFSRKLKLIGSLKELSSIIPLSGLSVPDAVSTHDAKRYHKSRRVTLSKSSQKNAVASGEEKASDKTEAPGKVNS